MKSGFILVFSILLVLGVFGQKEEISMTAILKDAGVYVQKVEMEFGKEIVRMEFDILQNTKTTFRTLMDQYEYGILAFGDYRIADIDIKVYKFVNSQWTLIAQDQTQDRNALVKIKPDFTADYMIEIIAYKFEPGFSVGHYGLIVFHD